MRWNLLWYVPLVMLVFLPLMLIDAIEGFTCFRILLRNWTWGLLLSPSAAVWCGTVTFSVIAPLNVFRLPAFFNPEGEFYPRRYRWSVIHVIATLALVLFSWVLIWGSFPLESRADGQHLRMIPFYPWPER
jgi:hypothetical protein